MSEAPERIWRTTDHVHSNRRPGPEYLDPQEYVRADLVKAAREEGRQAAQIKPLNWHDIPEGQDCRIGRCGQTAYSVRFRMGYWGYSRSVLNEHIISVKEGHCFKTEKEAMQGADSDHRKRIREALLDQPTFTPPDKTGCQECGGENPVWFAPHDLWNRVMGGEDCKDDPGGILCPVCFIRRAEQVGIKEIWWVGPVEDNPPRSKGMTVQEAARVILDAVETAKVPSEILKVFYNGNLTRGLRALSGDGHE